MFLQSIKMSDRLAFINLANILIRIDGVISPDEIEVVEAYMEEMQVDEINYNTEITFEEIINSISEDQTTRRIIIFELLGIAYSDADYSLEEKSFIYKVGNALRIDDEKLEQLEISVSNLIDDTQYATDLVSGVI